MDIEKFLSQLDKTYNLHLSVLYKTAKLNTVRFEHQALAPTANKDNILNP